MQPVFHNELRADTRNQICGEEISWGKINTGPPNTLPVPDRWYPVSGKTAARRKSPGITCFSVQITVLVQYIIKKP